MAGQRVYTGAVLLAVVALGCLLSSSQGATLNLINQCGDTITTYVQQNGVTTTADVANGATNPVNVGANWAGGAVWAENPNRALATLAEFTIQAGSNDFYDISVVNAYNLGVEIQPVTPNGGTCDDIKCTIAGLQGFCGQGSDNVYTAAGPGTAESCTNTDGPQQPQPECCCPTSNTMLFKDACPDAYSFSKDDNSSTFSCVDPTDYNIIFCPTGDSSNSGMVCNQ